MQSDDVLAQLMKGISGGWGGIEDAERVASEANQRMLDDERRQMREEAELVRRALDNKAGRQFLEWLARKTVLRPASARQAGATTAEAYAIEAAKREGQNSIFHIIADAIETGRGIANDARQKPQETDA